MFKKGFTLIELMVVISIITLFSSIVFASLTAVRARAQEATIKSDLKSIKSQAELSFNNVGNYSTASSSVSAIIDGINKSGGNAVFYTFIDQNQGGYDGAKYYDHWAVSGILNSDPTKSWSISDGGDTVVWDVEDHSSTPMNWYDATAACASAGKRLPSIEELEALCKAGGIAIGSGTYWSGTTFNDRITNQPYQFDTTIPIGTPITNMAFAGSRWSNTGTDANSFYKSSSNLKFRCVQ